MLFKKIEILEDNIKNFGLEDDLKFLWIIFDVSWTISIIIRNQL